MAQPYHIGGIHYTKIFLNTQAPASMDWLAGVDFIAVLLPGWQKLYFSNSPPRARIVRAELRTRANTLNGGHCTPDLHRTNGHEISTV
jgi:hypothetical protein